MSAAAAAADDPARLFLDYYGQAAQWLPDQRTTAPAPDLVFDDLARAILGGDDPQTVATELAALVDAKKCDPAHRRGRVLAAMRAIDDAFYRIHPRAVATTASGPPPRWLADARFARTSTGAYATTDNDRLIARGPLQRAPRHLYASSGDLLSDYFAALAVAPLELEHDGRRITVTMTVIGFDPFRGVPLGSDPGAEIVGFLPLARERADIQAVINDRGGRGFASYGPGATFDAGAAALEGLRALGAADIAIMPELSLSEDHVAALATALGGEAGPIARLIVAGSYSTNARSDGDQPWNECRVLNAKGFELWRQRKLWPAGVVQANATRFGLPDPGPDTLTLEDNAGGEELVVADVDGLGRCVVLICQDCEMPVLAPTLFSAYQPDWVFTPIFDCTIDRGRWAHARAFGLSQLSQARCVAVTNMAYGGTGANMGIAVGPKEVADSHADEVDRAVALVQKPAPPLPLVATLTWRDGTWEQTWLEARRA